MLPLGIPHGHQGIVLLAHLSMANPVIDTDIVCQMILRGLALEVQHKRQNGLSTPHVGQAVQHGRPKMRSNALIPSIDNTVARLSKSVRS